MEPKRLYKGHEKMLCGVCSGIAEYFNLDPTLVRLAAVALTIWWGSGLIAYIVAAIIMPEPPYNSRKRELPRPGFGRGSFFS